MRRSWLAVAAALAASTIAFAGCSASNGEPSSSTSDPGISGTQGGVTISRHPTVALCPSAFRIGWGRCYSYVLSDESGQAVFATTPQGFGPPDLRSAYGFPSTGGSGITVALVDAQDDPNAEADMGVYRQQYGLPACTTANGCFKKVDQTGGTNYPTGDTGWGGEISLDLDMVSAVCPGCNIILVEASSADMDDLGTAVNEAAALGANVISNSYGGAEDSTTNTESSEYFDHPGVLITASSGDDGFAAGASFPATSQYVLAVGGTSLTKASGTTRGWTETAWSDGGSGCSAYAPKPSWQKDTGCTKKIEADVSAVADPNTGLAVYDTYGYSGWIEVGGTSASSPIVASIMALTGRYTSGPSFPYSNPTWFNDVTSGSNGSCASGADAYFCKAGTGYDGPTGIGTPNVSLWSGAGNDAGSSPPPPVDAGAPPPVDAGSPPPVDAGGPPPPVDAGGGGGGTGPGQGSCSHALCSTGRRLTSSCDDPCTGEICSRDSYCCYVRWDSQCVSEVSSICHDTCN